MKRSGASCGLSFTCPAEIFSALQVTTDSGYDFLVTPIVHPRFRARSDMKRNYAFTRSDLLLSSSEWSSLVVGAVSRHLSLESPNAGVRRDAEDALQRELNFASHLGKNNWNFLNGKKSRENVLVLHCLIVDKFDFTRKIVN